MNDVVKLCPRCGSERSPHEQFCEGEVDRAICDYFIGDIALTAPVGVEAPAPPSAGSNAVPVESRCTNGHDMEAGDTICLVCGAYVRDAASADGGAESMPPSHPGAAAPEAPTSIDGWQLDRDIGSGGKPWRRFEVTDGAGRSGVLTLYEIGAEPDGAVHDVLRRMDCDHVPELMTTGRWDGRAYEVSERITAGSLRDAGFAGFASVESLARIVDEVGRALADFSVNSLRHRDINPDNILLRTREPLDLVITGFGSARLSDYDLDAVAPLELTMYSAPEAIVGGVSAASDWWSLGMVVLEKATAGACFENVNPQVFRIHVVTRGVPIPEQLNERVRLLLRGLLARDPLRRWQWTQVQGWLAGETPEAPADAASAADEETGPAIELGGRKFTRPEGYALAAAEGAHWDEAKTLTLRGAVTTWLEQRERDGKTIAGVRRVIADEELSEDFKHALVLMLLNPALPLTMSGEIVTPGWLLANPQAGYDLITGPVCRRLERIEREPWLARLHARATAVRERARLLEIELDEERLRVLLLATSRSRLEAERAALRVLFPDSDHRGLAPLLEHARITDEELIVLLAAAQHQFVSLNELVTKAEELAGKAGVTTFDSAEAQRLLALPRRELYKEVDDRTAAFARSLFPMVDDWADSYRVERRLSLPRAVVLLAIPAARWVQPPKQEYVAKLLGHFERRVVRAVQRGPLVRFTIGKTTPRVDLAELSTPSHPTVAALDHLVRRMDSPVELDPTLALQLPAAHTRLRRMVSNALTFRRDTGIDGRYLGFPFVVMRDERLSSSSRVRIAPVLLWPVAIELPVGTGGRTTLAFDREREEVRLNPALDGLLGKEQMERWTRARDDLLGRSQVRVEDVIDIFGDLAVPEGRTLTTIPDPKAPVRLRPGEKKLVCAAALFNAEFVGQAVAEDLRRLVGQPIVGTSLGAALRIDGDGRAERAASAPPPPSIAGVPHDLFLTVASDPSQESAVHAARSGAGLLVQGPPGTGKSQTIVNIVSDCIGRGESVLVVCQKQAAIDVVKKRLDAEGLSERAMVVTDVNKDRRVVLQTIREQLDRVSVLASSLVRRKVDRESSLVQLNRLDAELNAHHEAIRADDELAGMSYRDIVGTLVELEAPGIPPDVVRLRRALRSKRREYMSDLKLVVVPLSPLWLKARYEGSALHVLRQFPADEATAKEFEAAIFAYLDAENTRARLQRDNHSTFRVDDPQHLTEWMARSDAKFIALSDESREAAQRWTLLFRSRATPTEGDELLELLQQVVDEGTRVRGGIPQERMQRIASALPIDQLRGLAAAAQRATGPVSFWGRLSVPRWLATRQYAAWLTQVIVSPTESVRRNMCAALVHELQLRPLRGAVLQVRQQLRLQDRLSLVTLEEVIDEAQRLRGVLAEVRELVMAARSYPIPNDMFVVLLDGTAQAYIALRTDVQAALRRCEARHASDEALHGLSEWFIDAWTDQQASGIVAEEEPDIPGIGRIIAACPTLKTFQEFRARMAGFEVATREEVLSVFAELRLVQSQLDRHTDDEVEETVSCILDREALLAWKSRLEQERSALMGQRTEIERRVARLSDVDEVLRASNRALLANIADPATPGSRADWIGISRLHGPRSLRLREFFDRALELGLTSLRPVWLMNPDTASRLLPLRAKCFDVVIFDEASQMLVEHAVPAMFRASRVVVSGDEKQMPPTSFFLGRGGDPEEESEFDGTEWEDELSEAEHSILEDTWNRREIKDCPDLLALGGGFLPPTTLQVHYRSRYRELIEFSNAAFYGGKLSVPARHPDSEILRVRPIEVIREDGVYEAQTNPAEARRVVDELARIWARAGEAPPCIGVVTFNRKQADLVEDMIAELAEEDDAFRQAYVRERDRTQDGEDIGFFVKNVENVQGDERDMIIFSTTFGRDNLGRFRRSFGVLGQAGGERRLNVAVTRAREKVMLVTSMPISEVSDFLQASRKLEGPRDYLQAYLDYATKVSDGDLEGARAACRRLLPEGSTQQSKAAPTSDAFVQSVADYLRERGHTVVLGAASDAFGLDIAVLDPRTGQFGLAVECDSPIDLHGHLRSARARELWRPSVLRRAIPVVHRVTVRGWYEWRGEEQTRLDRALAKALGEVAA